MAQDATCRGEVSQSAPISLCAWHLAVAADWAGRCDGLADVLESACQLCGARVGIRFPSGWICGVCEWRVGLVPDADVAPPRVDVVYYLRNGDRMKIGTTANPRQRFAAIWHDEVVAFERGGRLLERRRHEQFARERLDRSEWFQLSSELQRHAETIAAGVDDPWALYARWTSEALALRS